MKAALAIALVMLTGCASMRPNPDEWTDKERLAFGLSIAAHAADAVTTARGLEGGCVELNPLLGSAPSISSIIAVKIVVLGLQYVIFNTPGMGDNTHVYGYIAAGLVGGAAAWNSQQDCGR